MPISTSDFMSLCYRFVRKHTWQLKTLHSQNVWGRWLYWKIKQLYSSLLLLCVYLRETKPSGVCLSYYKWHIMVIWHVMRESELQTGSMKQVLTFIWFSLRRAFNLRLDFVYLIIHYSKLAYNRMKQDKQRKPPIKSHSREDWGAHCIQKS